MAVQRTSSAHWEGDLKNGKGQLELASGAYSGSYTFASRFESGDGTNPEELIAAANAACFAMALSNMLDQDGHTPDRIEADAQVTLDDEQLKITTIEITCRGRVPGIDEDTFLQHAEDAKAGCPVSKVLAGADEITLDATLVS